MTNKVLFLKDFIRYQEKVVNLLREKLIEKNISPANIRIDYFYRGKNNSNLIFDVAIVNDQDEVSQIYEIKTIQSVKSVSGYIKTRLLLFEEETKAKAFLVYLDSKGTIQIKPVDKIDSDKEPLDSNNFITSFSDFNNQLSKHCNSANYEMQLFFRGHANINWKCIPNIYRKNNEGSSLIKYEDIMFHEAIRYWPSDFPDEMSTFDKLVKMQHYKLPTRLLDITTNPLVALYFACCSNNNVDGSVLIFRTQPEQRKYYDSDTVCILSNLAKRPIDFNFKKDRDYLIYDIQQEKNHFKDIIKPIDIRSVFCVLPKLNNERIIRQSGGFFLFGIENNKKDRSAMLKINPISINIKASAKNKILKELSYIGINEAFLFPDEEKIMQQIQFAYKNKI